ncbi:Cyclic-di-AMP phosphodiesterase GdpP [bioreactor metagenome]|uniref:Cyclic-di-AMP phosphodiesterase GdpP n=1 Tax=bioreactor metagenome TaxID=1076179 RepID=A0A644UNB4_9ZZZZ|nr:DHH family phosphoesterase [Acidaminococcaceae bacterium]NLU43931.1 diguanylate cyclase [Acholeplasmataceae bacterium]
MEKVSKRFWDNLRMVIGILGSVAVLFGIFKGDLVFAFVGFIVLLIVYYFSQRNSRIKEAWLNHYLDTVVRNIERANNYAVQRIPVGIAVFDKEGHLQWKNELFATWVGGKADEGDSMSQVLPPPENNFATISLKDSEKQIKIADRSFNMLVRRIQTSADGEHDTGIVIYLIDITDRERQRKRYEAEKVCFAYLQFDNFNDVMKGLNESIRANLAVEVTKAIGQWAEEMQGVFLRYADDLYMVSISRKALEETIARKFDVLDRVREIKVGNKIPPTISMGVASDERGLLGLSQKAQSGLDLALGRGGDQAVVSIGGEMLFFGAKSSVQAKSTRVRARVVSQAIHELMINADKVFVMGHVNEDYDAIGASLGVAKMAMSFHKETYIVTSGQGTSLERMEDLATETDQAYAAVLVNEDQAMEHITTNSLLILVDHHRPMLSASQKVLKAIERRVIIDHHRRSEDAIKNAILFYMEPASSSTSELVTEMLHYFDDTMEFTTLEASALYAGILVDTKNFAVQTGERTFEAAAFLRRSGADPGVVSQLFKDDQATVMERARLISQARIPYPGLAISIYRNAPEGQNTSVIIAQTADELLTMDDINVSVVMSEAPDGLGISARSDGNINVQIMMEELGGGGHQTVAGVKVKGITADEMEVKIIAMAKKQLEEREADENNITTGR